MKNDNLTIFVLFNIIFTSTIGYLNWMPTEYEVLLFRFWYLMSVAIWLDFAITLIALFDRLSCLDKLRNELQKTEEKMNDRKV